MPVYEYRCERCGCRFEKLSFSMSPPAPACRECAAAEVVRVPSSFGMSGVEHQTTSRSGCAGCSGGSCSSCH